MAAHIDGRSGSVVDMTGLAQKGGSVFSHVKIGETEDTVVGGRVPAASTDVLIACDLLVAASPEGLSLYAKDRTVAFGNSDFAPTADFVTSRDVKFDSGAMARRVKGATKTFDACPAQHLAESQFGDAIYANMIMVGFAWQRGVIPVSSRAFYRAIKLNGVDAEANLQAFELGRRIAHDPSAAGPKVEAVATPETMPLDGLIAKRTAELTAYQNAAYAERYAAKVAKVRAAEVAASRPDSALPLTRAAAVNLYKLMAYKDEYEVARLHSDPVASLAQLDADVPARATSVKVLTSRRRRSSKPRTRSPATLIKRQPSARWMGDCAFGDDGKRFKGLRGGRAGRLRQDRRAPDRSAGLMADYEIQRSTAAVGRRCDPTSLPLALKIAAIPEDIRGYGHVKDASVVTAKAAEAKLWEQWAG